MNGTSQRTCENRRIAFTLTEILVVLGIVCLLAAILFPVIGRIKEVGRQTTCSSNLRQMGLAFQEYLQDSRGVFPSDRSYGAHCVWTHRLLQYAKSPQIFECPSYPQGPFNPACSEPEVKDDLSQQWFNGGYNLNKISLSGRARFNQNMIRQPSNMVIVCDGLATHDAVTTPSLNLVTSTDALKDND